MKTLALNKRARYDYEIFEIFEAGLVLKGHEVKSVKLGHISLTGSYVVIKNGEAYLLNAHISLYQPKNIPQNYDPTRTKKLLLHKKEIKYLIGKSEERGLTLVPIRVYTNKDKIKLEFGVGKGKKKTDKREIIKKREFEREKDRYLKQK